MDLMQENPNEENKVKNLKNSLIVIIAFALVLIIIAVVIYIYSLRITDEKLKIRIDGTSNSELEANEKSVVFDNDKDEVYLSIKDIGPKLNYEILNGEYKQYTEDTNSCYGINKNQLEVVTFKSGSNEIRKYKPENSSYKTFELEDSVVNRSDRLYINIKDMKRAFNTLAEYDKATNTITITTLPYLTKSYEDTFSEAYLTKKEGDNRTTELTDIMFFNNQKALLSSLVITRDSDEKGLLGVSSYNEESKSLNEVITKRYKTIEFVEGVEDFIVKTEDEKYGIISRDGITKIKPDYDEIEEIDKNLGLYLYSRNGKKGIINESGKTIVHEDYDQIGLNPDFDDFNIKNRFILYEKCIPVMVNKKWGFIDINGEKIVVPQYDGVGCKLSSSDANTSGIVIIPELEGIVVEVDEKNDNNEIKRYGIINMKGETIMYPVAEEAYAFTMENKTTYYIKYQSQEIDIVSYWKEEREKNNTNPENNQQEDSNTTEEQQNQVQNQQENQVQEEQKNTDQNDKNAIIQQIYNQMTDEQKQSLQQMSQEQQQQVLEQYYQQYIQSTRFKQ